MAELQLPSYMTTPELRVGPPPPYTSTSLQINLFFRVFLGILANLLCWVPMRLLWKNGEFSAAVYCGTTMTLNLYYVVNALIWRDNNVKDWFAGYGWCDLQMYTVFALETLYAACIFEIMRNLANKVAMMRATSLTSSEKRRRVLIEALIIFPFPLLQVIMTYFVLAQRYNVSTLIGCTNFYYRSWPYLVVYHIPTNVFSILTVFYGCLTWFRFRQVEKTTRTARGNTSSGMHARHQRIRRKLFLMCMCILIPFFPMQMFWLYANIAAGLNNLKPYDFKKIHDPATFNLVTLTTSQGMSFFELNGNYMAIITVLPIFWFFGFTKEAINTYRVYCLDIGLGRFFPKLHEEYDPDRTRSSNGLRSWGQNISGFLKSGRNSSRSSGRARSADGSRKNSIIPSFQHLSVATTTTNSTTSRTTDTIDDHISIAPPAKTESDPWPDVTVPEPAARSQTYQPAVDDDVLRTQNRNPFIFRTMLANPVRLFAQSRDAHRSASAPPRQMPLSELGASSPTRHHPQSGSDTKSLVGSGMDSRDSDVVPPWTAVGSSAAAAGGRGSNGASAKVQTRVWSEDLERHPAVPSSGKRGVSNQDREVEEAEIGLAVSGGRDGVRVETSIARSEREL